MKNKLVDEIIIEKNLVKSELDTLVQLTKQAELKATNVISIKEGYTSTSEYVFIEEDIYDWYRPESDEARVQKEKR